MASEPTVVSGFRLIDLPVHGDDRGCLVALEAGISVPFRFNRVYYIFDTKPGIHRGFHAHRKLRQLAVAVKGSCKFTLNNGFETKEVVLDSPRKGLLIEGLIWREMSEFSSDCVLMVLADQLYDEDDYIRDFDRFIEAARGRQ